VDWIQALRLGASGGAFDLEILALLSSCFRVVTSTGHYMCLRHCATNRKVAGSIPDGVIGIFHLHNPSGRTMALGSTQPLT
jgi:hypothetical protein